MAWLIAAIFCSTKAVRYEEFCAATQVLYLEAEPVISDPYYHDLGYLEDPSSQQIFPWSELAEPGCTREDQSCCVVRGRRQESSIV